MEAASVKNRKRNGWKRKRKQKILVSTETPANVQTDAALAYTPTVPLSNSIEQQSQVMSKDESSLSTSTAVKLRKRKKRKHENHQEHNQVPIVASTLDPTRCTTEPTFPFLTNNDDHCETPVEAYQDILPFLHAISKHLKKDSSQTIIYDPYYCSGSVIQNLTSCGYPNVWNKKEDCYSVWESNTSYPQYDVLLTNPPYSSDHIQKLILHLTSKTSLHASRPWFLLLPTWVHKKDYYTEALSKNVIQPFYVVPSKRYVYKPPSGFREKRPSDVHKKNSPFVSMWYIYGGSYKMTETLIQEFTTSPISAPIRERCALARTKSALRDLRRKK